MRHLTWLVLALTACTSAEEKARQHEAAMIAQAQADSAAEADFVADSLALAASITVDTVRQLRQQNTETISDDGEEAAVAIFQAVSPRGHVCAVTAVRYQALAIGDTLTCQWGPPE
ncbi:MAG: hypothetical protein V4813_18470 [Gemmatimonadota bacterium]